MINHAEMGSPAPNAKPGALTQRPSVGPVVPITAINVRSDELRGGSSPDNRPPATDPFGKPRLGEGRAHLRPRRTGRRFQLAADKRRQLRYEPAGEDPDTEFCIGAGAGELRV